MTPFIPLVLFCVLLSGALNNFPVNPKTDGTLQTRFTIEEMLFAAALLFSAYVFYWHGLRKRLRHVKYQQQLRSEQAQQLADQPTPATDQSIEAHRAEGQRIQQHLSDIRAARDSADKPSQGRTVISAFAGNAQWCRDGHTLFDFSGSPRYQFDGTYIHTFAGNRVYTWSNNTLSLFAAAPLYRVHGHQISEFSGAVRFQFYNDVIAEFAGPPLYSIRGDTDVPVAIIVLIAAGLVSS